jgi:Fe-S-cluster containining protein
MCSIYDIRPLACREYFVKGSEKACAGGCGTAEKIQMPVRTAEVLTELASELEGTDPEAVMLPLVLIWHADNLSRSNRTWPAIEMVERFVEIVKETAHHSATVGTKSETWVQTDRQDLEYAHAHEPL